MKTTYMKTRRLFKLFLSVSTMLQSKQNMQSLDTDNDFCLQKNHL